MTPELTIATIGAAAVIIAALIGLIVALTTAVIAKEQKVAEFRQAWINELRNEVAVMLTSISGLLNESKLHRNKLKKLNMKTSTEEKLEFSSKLKLIVESMYKVNLRLNPDRDRDIINEINAIKKLLVMVLNEKHDIGDPILIRRKAGQLSRLFHNVFKSEWERVKNGELLYRGFNTTAKIIVTALFAAFLVLVLIGSFPHLCS